MCIKNCVICGKELPEKRIKQNKDTCCKSCALKFILNKPEVKEKHNASIKRAWESQEARQRASERNKISMNKPEVKEKHSKAQKARWSSQEERIKMSKKLKQVYESAELRKKISDSVKTAFEDAELHEKISKSVRRAYETTELRKKISNSIRRTYENPEVHEKISKSVRKAWPRIIETKRKNGTLSTSKPEQKIKELLEQTFTKVQYQYKCDKYPFNCDFYIEDLDLFIELNFHWTHGFMPYNAKDTTCQEQLINWQKKAQTSKYWQSAITVWTFYDVQKLNTFKNNKLNYKIFYNYKDFEEWHNAIKKGIKK